jgi:hypothetical protein
MTFAACSDTTDLVTTDSSQLLGAQCTYDDFRATADACFATYETCATASGADVEACLDALHACLPPPPRPPGGPGPGHGDGGCDHDGDRPPPPDGFGPPPDGGRPPPPGGDGQHRPPPPLPPPEEVQACRDALDACLVATPSETETCRDTAHACVRDAFAAAFQARCEEAATRCAEPGAPADKCADITARCAQGVDGLPPEEAATTCTQ